MFFAASKLLQFLLMPTVWVVAGLLWALWKRSWRGVGLVLAAFWLLGNECLSNAALAAWEVPAVPLAALQRPYPCAVVLGGFTQTSGGRPKDRTYLNQAADRLMHGVLLYKRGKAERLLITGGNGSLMSIDETEAQNAERVTLLCGIPHAAYLAEPRARNTHENALYAKQILDSLGIRDTVLLVTSASHARRSAGCFAKVGVPFRLFTTDAHAQPPRFTPDVLLIPTAEAFQRWDALIHEWAGMASYKAVGWI